MQSVRAFLSDTVPCSSASGTVREYGNVNTNLFGAAIV